MSPRRVLDLLAKCEAKRKALREMLVALRPLLGPKMLELVDQVLREDAREA